MAQEFIVSTTQDENDGDFSTGDLSLREAIALSNETAGADTITFDDSLNGSTITLVKDQSTGRPSLANAPLVITDSVNITGLGAENITIDGDNGGNGIFEIGDGSQEISVTVEDVTLANGAQVAFFAPGLSDPGGTFLVSENANLTLQDSIITGSSASIGGAIYNDGTTYLVNSTIENSSSSGDGAATAPLRTDGVIVNRNKLNISNSIIQGNSGSAIGNFGELEVDSSNIYNNSSQYGGGGLDNGNTAIITNSTIADNNADTGSGIRNRSDGTLTLDRSIVEGNNSSSSDNNAIYSLGTTNITSSTVRDHNGGSNVGIVVESGTTTIENSTVANNDAPDIGVSGVIVRSGATADIINSTIVDNDSRSSAGVSNSGTVNINNSTIANNEGGIGPGGVNSFSGGVANITSSIIANNTGSGDGLVGDINGEFISGGNNLIGNGDDTSGFVDSDIVGTLDSPIDPQLGELQDNGGVTETVALQEGSPAIDVGSNPNNLETDQRGEGFDRTAGNGTDIGAYEVQSDDGNNGGNGEENEIIFVSTTEDENDGDLSEGDLSLREAVALANETPGADTISFSSELLLTGNIEILLTQGELEIEDDLTIYGSLEPEGVTISGNNNSRVFNIDDGNAENSLDVKFRGFTITEGVVARDDTDNLGGGILNRENLNLIDVDLIDNSAEFVGDGAFTSKGGAIYTSGDLELVNSTITGNNATFGGAIYSQGATVEITSSRINNNYAGFVGGGIYVNDSELKLEDSTVTGNDGSFAFGGIAFNTSTGTILETTVSDNNALNASDGGIALADNSEVDIRDSTISGNTALDNGGGISVGDDSTANITNSTIGNNSAGENGGGISTTSSSTVNLKNSTVSGNTANNNGSGIYQRPNYVFEYDGSTVTGATVNITSSIVAKNANNDDLSGDRINSNGNNLIGNGDSVTGFVDSDLVGTSDNPLDPRLDELQDNFGSSPTFALLPDSPAIDAGSNPDNLEFDQRGSSFARTVGNGTDIGAFEVQDVSENPENPETPVDDFLVGTNDNDLLDGLAGNDQIVGRNGNDTLIGGNGNDTLVGGTGDDSITGDNGNDVLIGNAGNDTLIGGKGNDTLIGGTGNDSLDGSGGEDILFGSEGHDTLSGGDGNDILYGGSGNDLIIGGNGANTLSGGQGHDVFVLTSDNHQDTIVDFSDQSDRLQLEGGLTFDNLNIINNESNTGVFILDSTNHDSVVALIENIHAEDITSHDFV